MAQKLVIHVDDEEAFVTVSKLILKKITNNINIVSFTSSSEALEYILKYSPKIDAIISDFNMPYINVIELLNEIRRNKLCLPFIFLTGMKNDIISSLITNKYCNCYYIEKDNDLIKVFTKISQIIMNETPINNITTV